MALARPSPIVTTRKHGDIKPPAPGLRTVSRDVVVIGASAGGIGTIQRLVQGLPAELPAALFVVMHFPPDSRSALPGILQRAGALRAVPAEDGMPIEHGTIYVAAPDHHLVLRPGKVRVVRGPKENGYRPAVDVLFRTAAVSHGPRVIGVVLSGNLGDGAAGLSAIRRRGGTAVVQDPADAHFPSMPRSAIEEVDGIEHVLPIDAMAALLVRLVAEPIEVRGGIDMADEMELEAEIAEMNHDDVGRGPPPGKPAAFGCPDCGGALFTLSDEVVRFRCRVGHAWKGDALLARQGETLENALWVALRALEEQEALARQVAARFERRGHESSHQRFLAQADLAAARAVVIRDALREPRIGAEETTGDVRNINSAGDTGNAA